MPRRPDPRDRRPRSRAVGRTTSAARGGLAAVIVLAACGPAADSDPADGRDPEARPDPGAISEVHAVAQAAPAVATTFAEARSEGEADVVFFYVPSSGFAYRDEEARLTGVTAELLRDFAGYVAERYGIDMRIEWQEEERWADFYGYVRDSEGGAFGVGNVTITDERRAELDFSPPYLTNVAVLVTHESVPELDAMEVIGDAFRGLTALPYPGTLHEARLNAIRDRWLPDMPIRPVASNDELLALIAEGGRFGYMDVYNYWRARQAGQPLRRHSVGDDASETFGVILPHGSDWTAVMEEFFSRDGGYVESDRFGFFLRTHLGEELAGLLTD